LAALREAKLVDGRAMRVKIVKKGEIDRAVKISGILATAGAKAAIEAAGGSVE
jgi:large subunit ribosomal protein L15